MVVLPQYFFSLMCCVISSHLGQSLAIQTSSLPDQHSGPIDYCHIPKSISGSEGRNLKGYTLKHVDVLLTPGQIDLPLKVKVQGQTSRATSCDLKFDVSFSDKANTFEDVSDVYRVVQKERHGFKDLHPTFSSSCSNYHVTSYGLQQMISLGEHFNRAYFQTNSDSKLTLKAANIHVESLPDLSTYQSLLPFLHGLLPEKQFTRVKVHKSLDNFCSMSGIETGTCVCRHVEDLHPYISRALERGQVLFKDDMYESELVTSIMEGCVHSGDVGAVELFEYLMLYQCNNMSSLCLHSTSCLCPTEQQLRQLYLTSSHYLHQLNTHPIFKSFSELKAYPFLSRLVNRSLHNHGERLNVYMGTRPFFQFLRTSLELQEQEVMPLGSRFVFEIFQKNWGQPDHGELYLRTFFNGKDVTEDLIGCKDLENGLCPMKRFNTSIHSIGKKYSASC